MKQMKYTKQRTVDVLSQGEIDGYKFFIISYGTHPCCYVVLPKGHKYYGKEYDSIELLCNGGITYSENNLHSIPTPENTWVIGWDYAHCHDYTAFMAEFSSRIGNLKKWTTQELISEVVDVISQLTESEE